MKFGRIFESPFARGVAVLTGGTVFAQALMILVLPILTRLYTPDEFGVLAVFVAILSIISVVACLRYEIAIPLPESDADAANLGAVALLSMIGTCILTVFLVIVFDERIVLFVNQPALGSYLWLLPIAVALTCGYAVFQYWATRKKAYKRIARTRLEQSVGGISTQLIFGWAGAGVAGLIVGQIVSNGAGFLGLARRAVMEDKKAIQSVSLSRMRKEAIKHMTFPKYSTLEALANIAGLQVPIIMIAGSATSAEVGFLLLAMQILQAPMSLIGSSIAQVFYSHAVDAQRKGTLFVFTKNTVKKLAIMGFWPILTLAIAGPYSFGILLGEGWERSGVLLTWLAPFFFLQFLASPVSMALHVQFRQGVALAVQFFGLVLRIGAILVFPEVAGEAFAVSSAIFYVGYLIVILMVVARTSSNLDQEVAPKNRTAV